MVTKFVKLAAGVVGTAALSTSCASEAQEPTTFVVEGLLSAQASEWNADGALETVKNIMHPKRLEKWVGKQCLPAEGHNFGGERVTVRNSQDEVVAIGSVSELAVNQMDNMGIDGFGYLYCEFAFKVEEIPEGSDFYSVEIGQRGPVNFSAEELQSGQLIRLS